MTLAALRATLIDQLTQSHPSTWPALVARMIADLGGSLTPANPAHGWGPHWWELSLLEALGTGETFEEAVRDWTKCTSRMCMAEAA